MNKNMSNMKKAIINKESSKSKANFSSNCIITGLKPVDVAQEINKMAAANSHFAKAWADSRNEADLIHALVKLRKEQNITQKELATRIGTTQQVISRFEHKEDDIRLSTLCKISHVLGYQLILKKI